MMQRQGAIGADGAPAPSGAAAAAAQQRQQQRGRAPGERQPLPERALEYLREVRAELQKVAWPGRSEVANYTLVVLVAVVLLTLYIFGLDVGFAKLVIELFQKA
jgi:preprotein translocase subunit SecE